MGYAATQQHAAHNSATDSFFGMALAQAFMGFAFGADVETAWEAAEIGSEFYVDRHSSSARKSGLPANGTNGKFELGVKNTLASIFDQPSARPAPDVGLDLTVPYWLKHPDPRRGRAWGLAA
jgi:hypothetical protein